MPKNKVICPGLTPASVSAAEFLQSAGWKITQPPDWSARHLLLDVPSFGPGRLEHPDTLLASLPPDTVIYGGNLTHPSLSGFQTVDFLKDPFYLAENARITADCAMRLAAPLLTQTFDNLRVLIIGWGRIGKCLGKKLKAAGADVTVSARKSEDLAMLNALGYRAVHTYRLEPVLPECRLIFNTVPECILDEALYSRCRDCVKIDLASVKGIPGNDVIWARGLPGIHAPESSGLLIAKTFLRLAKEVNQ